MIEALSSWVQSLVLLLLFVAFLQLLLPEHPLRDYTRVVLGLVLIAAVLGPLLTLIDSPTWEEAARNALAALEAGVLPAPGAAAPVDAEPWIARGHALAQRARGRIWEEARRSLDARVRSLVLSTPGVRDAAVSSRWDGGGNLQQIRVDLWMMPAPAPDPALSWVAEGTGGAEEAVERVRTMVGRFLSLPAWRVDVRLKDGG